MKALLHWLCPTPGDVFALVAWLTLAAFYLWARFSAAADVIDRAPLLFDQDDLADIVPIQTGGTTWAG